MFVPTLPDGLVLEVAHPNLSRKERASVVLGLAERAELRLVTRRLAPDADVVDLGVSIGLISRGVTSNGMLRLTSTSPW